MILHEHLTFRREKIMNQFVRPLKIFLLFFMSISLLAGCGEKTVVKPVSPMDNPLHHYIQGMNALDEEGKDAVALQKFERALSLQPSFSPALSGKAIIQSRKTDRTLDTTHKATEIKRTLELLESAENNSESNADHFIYHVAATRVYSTIFANTDWLSDSLDSYNDAIKIEGLTARDLPHYKNKNGAHYFMAVAYWRAGEFRKAEGLLATIQSSSGEGKWQVLSNDLYRRAQKIIRASANYTLTNIAKKIAVKDQVTRADVAALIVTELKVDKLFGKQLRLMGKEVPKAPAFIPVDANNNIFSDEIMTVLRWKVKGLEPKYDATSQAKLFKPDTFVTRKELALIMQDVLIKITGDKSIATSMIGNKSPFPDVNSSSPWFNAIMTMTSRNLMEPDFSSKFNPAKNADGAELLLATFQMRRHINIH